MLQHHISAIYLKKKKHYWCEEDLRKIRPYNGSLERKGEKMY
jgi:hypothetical protein